MDTATLKVFCKATFRYMPRAGGGPAGQDVPVYDARAANLPGWQECGFELLKHPSTVTDWNDDEQMSSIHYGEMSALAKTLTGADYALVSGHIRRSPAAAEKHRDLSPIAFVHSDFADSYGDLIKDMYRQGGVRAEAALSAGLKPEQAAEAKRIVIFQFWRNIGPAKMDMPLAFCDTRSLRMEDARAFPVKNYAGGGFDFDALGVLAPEKPGDHHWYVYPEMKPDEVVAFRTYDTEMVGGDRPYWVPHSAINDPEVEPGKPARESIELRATCLWL